MTIPDYQSLMLPLLRLAAAGGDIAHGDAVTALAEELGLSAEECAELQPSGGRVFAGRVGWARAYLKQAGLLSAPRRGAVRITPEGEALLKTAPERIDNTVLKRFGAFQDFLNRSRAATPSTESASAAEPSMTPEDAMAEAYERLRGELTADLLEQIKTVSPAFFERLVVDLLVAMGYGGSRADAGRALGRSGDGGIDGVIKEDRLGLDVIYLQAKRWAGVVGRPEIQKFAGALQGQRAAKGVFITTSSYTREALDYVSIIPSKIILIDGSTLAGLMVDHNVGVATVSAYELKRIDSDYFEDE